MYLYFCVNFFIGTCLASHACLIYDRFDSGNFIFSRSKCCTCNYEINILDEIPIFSYLLLKGKCRYCHANIPYQLPIFEFLGGIALINNDFNSKPGILNAIFIFFFLLISIFDYYDGEFLTILLIPLLLVLPFKSVNLFSIVEAFPIILLLSYYSFKNKLGSGDLILYLFICLYLNVQQANIMLLVACLLTILHYFSSKNFSQKQIHFLPYLFLSFALVSIL